MLPPGDFPIDEALPALKAALAAHRGVVLVAPPGAGKTTRAPLALLDAPWLAGLSIIMLAPRRLAARAAAARMARTLGEPVGRTVGHAVRLDRKIGPDTRVEVVTEGVFTRRILADPELTGVGCVIFDEAHERNLEADLGLALALDAQAGLREDLRILAMSATLDGARVAELLGPDAPLVRSEGRAFPVSLVHLDREPALPIEAQVARAVRRALAETDGDVLAFLPGAKEIRRTGELLAAPAPDVDVLPLHGALDVAAQDAATAPATPGRRRVVLSSAIAETSVTIDGVRAVVDSGLSRRPAFEPASGLTRLQTVRASRAAADQRAGRAGRTAPGVCYRLWGEAETRSLPAYERPEILDADLAPLALTLAAWGVRDPAALRWLDPPPAPAWSQATAGLQALGAIDADGRLLAHGRALAEFPLPPRLAHMIMRAAGEGFSRVAAMTAAVLQERGLGGTGVDLADRVSRLLADTGDRARKARGQAEGWARLAGGRAGEALDLAHVGACVALAWPERVAMARDRAGGFVLAGGQGGEVDPGESLAGAEFLAIAELQGSARHARVVAAAALSRATVESRFAADIVTREEVAFDREARALRARRTRRLGAITLESAPLAAPREPEAARAALCEAVRTHGLDLLPWDARAKALRARLDWLHARDRENWPGVDDASLLAGLEAWLAPALGARPDGAALSRVDVGEALTSLLDWAGRGALDRLAPSHVTTPAGGRHPIDYAAPQGPTVSVRVQEVFGLATHPGVGPAGVPLIFELLSPAHRPIARTADLPGFWRGAWADVRKDMRARYPKHLWPEDPANAAPTTRAKPRPA
jgi:ATP-dependent helicase HrpB